MIKQSDSLLKVQYVNLWLIVRWYNIKQANLIALNTSSAYILRIYTSGNNHVVTITDESFLSIETDNSFCYLVNDTNTLKLCNIYNGIYVDDDFKHKNNTLLREQSLICEKDTCVRMIPWLFPPGYSAFHMILKARFWNRWTIHK